MNPCRQEWTDQFLQGSLSTKDQAKFEAHLEGCLACRELLTLKSGDEQTWQAAKELLHYLPDASSSGELCASAEVLSPSSRQFAEADAQVLSFLAPSDDPAMMGRIGTYEIIGLLGRGAAGIVLKGFDRSLSRNVAIKVLDPTAAHVGAARERFAREARAMAAITHEHVVPVYGVDVHQGLPYFVMEYVAGGSLDRRLLSEGPLEVVSVVRIGLQAAQALDAAHQQGLVHRDIKPGNILIDKGTERVRVADFGLARVMNEVSCTRSGFIAGTPQYMAPEQVRAETCDARADLFSLGAVMYAMCTGHPPFRAETVYAVMHRIVHEPPRSIREQNPKTPEWLEQFILQLLDKNKDQRFASASDVAGHLQEELAYLQNPISANRPQRAWYKPVRASWKLTWKKRVAMTAAALLVLTVGAFPILDWSPSEKHVAPAAKSHAIDGTPRVFVSSVPLWNADGTQDAKNAAAQLESQMLALPLAATMQFDPWATNFSELLTEIRKYESSDTFAPSPAIPSNSSSPVGP